jgi:hypothetical protein
MLEGLQLLVLHDAFYNSPFFIRPTA